MEFKDRLAQRLKETGMTQTELAKRVKVSKTTITFWKSGTNKLSGENLMALAKALRCSARWLATGEGQPVPEGLSLEKPWLDMDDASNAEHSNVAPALQPRRAPRAYPLISWVAAGERAESPDNYYPGDGEEMLESTENAGEHGYWLRVKGRSMTSETPPSFPPDTPILVRPEGFDVISGKFYIAKHRDGETTFKQYVRDAGTAYLVPLNPAFNQVEMDDEWRLIGRVVDAKITGL